MMEDRPDAPQRSDLPDHEARVPATGEEQHLYARWLDRGMRAGLVLAVGGWCLSWWPATQGRDADHLLQNLRRPAGGLATNLGPALGDIGLGHGIGLAGVALLAACALPALVGLLPLARRQHDRVLIGLVLGQALVIALGIASTTLR